MEAGLVLIYISHNTADFKSSHSALSLVGNPKLPPIKWLKIALIHQFVSGHLSWSHSAGRTTGIPVGQNSHT